MIYKLSEFCEVINGRAYKQSELLSSGKYLVLRVGNFFSSDRWYYSDLELPKKNYCQNGDLLFAWACSFGPRIWHGENNTIFHYHIWKMVPDESIIDKIYLYYLLKLSTRKLLAGTHGSVMVHITKADMEKAEFDVPPVDVQKKVVAILRSIDEKIDLNNRINGCLLEQIRGLTANRLTTFGDPDAHASYLLSDIATFINGYSYKGNELVADSKIALAGIKNFNRNGGFKTDGFKSIIPSTKVKPEQFLNLFDLTVACTDLTQGAEVIGNAELITSLDRYDRIIMSMDLVKVMSKCDFPRFVLSAVLMSDAFKNHCLGYVNGTTVLHLRKEALSDFRFGLTGDPSKIEPLYEELFTKISTIASENEKLSALRDSLLPKLMSGEIDVDSVDLG